MQWYNVIPSIRFECEVNSLFVNCEFSQSQALYAIRNTYNLDYPDILVPKAGRIYAEYRIAGNFRGQADLHEILT